MSSEENSKREEMAKASGLVRIVVKLWQANRFEEIGRGGEAIVYKLNKDVAAKVFLTPDTIEFADDPIFQEAATLRIKEMQEKLFQFPKTPHSQVVSPSGVMENPDGHIFGYTMPFVEGRSFDRLTKTSAMLRPKEISDILLSLYELIHVLHNTGVVIGDLNENNIILADNVPHIIDTDSMQFGGFICRAFTPRFTDPHLLSIAPPREDGRILLPRFSMRAPHTEISDWYAFLVLAMRLLTFTEPYGGVLGQMGLPERIEQRVTVFDKRVIYPSIARPLASIPRPVLEIFFRVFHRQERFVPDKEVFNYTNWPA